MEHIPLAVIPAGKLLWQKQTDIETTHFAHWWFGFKSIKPGRRAVRRDGCL